MRRRLAPDRMAERALWDRAYILVRRAYPLVNNGPKDLEITLDQLHAVLKEIQLRGQQLSLLPEDPRPFPRKSA